MNTETQNQENSTAEDAERPPVELLVMTHYSQGIAGDGPCILMDGMPLTPEEIVNSLIHKTHAIKRLTELLEQHVPGIFDDNTETGPEL